jgi:hypothetical protein
MKVLMDGPGVVVCHGNEVYRLGLVATMENANYTVHLVHHPRQPVASVLAVGGGPCWLNSTTWRG